MIVEEFGKSRKAARRLMKDVREFGLAFVLLAGYMVLAERLFGAFCPASIITGLPCPGCGITRAALLLLTGRWQQAWQMHPVIFPIAFAAIYFGINRYWLDKRASGMKEVMAGIVVLLLAVYVLRMRQYFPGRAPYTYHGGNVLETIAPAYPSILFRILGCVQ